MYLFIYARIMILLHEIIDVARDSFCQQYNITPAGANMSKKQTCFTLQLNSVYSDIVYLIHCDGQYPITTRRKLKHLQIYWWSN